MIGCVAPGCFHCICQQLSALTVLASIVPKTHEPCAPDSNSSAPRSEHECCLRAPLARPLCICACYRPKRRPSDHFPHSCFVSASPRWLPEPPRSCPHNAHVGSMYNCDQVSALVRTAPAQRACRRHSAHERRAHLGTAFLEKASLAAAHSQLGNPRGLWELLSAAIL